jgi:hypothetical protein
VSLSVVLPEVLVTGPTNRSSSLRFGLGGAVIGIVVAVIAVIVIDRLVAGKQNDHLWLPVGVIAGIIGGGVIGMLLSQVIIGGRESKRATQEGFDARTKHP